MNTHFNTFVSSTKMFVTRAKLVCPRAKSVRLQHNKHICLLLGRWFRKHPKERKLGKKVYSKTSFQLKMALKKVKNKVEMKERKKTILHLLCIFADVG